MNQKSTSSPMVTRMTDGANRHQSGYWDKRYAEAGYAYGTAPNDFLVAMMPHLRVGKALCLCEGEGRNAIYLARHGFIATAVDFSQIALDKAQALAHQRGLTLHTHCANLADFDPGIARWDLVTMIFGQPEQAIRRALYARIAACLRPGGAFVLETKAQEHATPDSLYPGSAQLCAELAGLSFTIARDGERLLQEGRYHDGVQRTAQVLAFKNMR
jgi:2-polyprenyl-3-methyl-5-hydroxy-6-metoxy-1,4-benzoquinol methylase